MNIVLCGMMGSGKTTVGGALARKTGRACVDTDEYIVARHGKISDIFAERGEAYFRTLETEAVKELSQRDGLVLATGGGLVLKEENVRLLKRNAKIFFLSASCQTLFDRLKEDTSRPLLKDKDKLSETLTRLLSERTPRYLAAADEVVQTDGKSAERIAEEILAKMEE